MTPHSLRNYWTTALEDFAIVETSRLSGRLSKTDIRRASSSKNQRQVLSSSILHTRSSDDDDSEHYTTRDGHVAACNQDHHLMAGQADDGWLKEMKRRLHASLAPSAHLVPASARLCI